jgi:hypothetical protein
MALLSLGPWWVFGGHRLELGSWAPPALASLFEEVPVVDRISRWYRAGSVAVLLLIPVAVRAGPPRRLLFLAPLVLLDGRFGAPLPLELYRVEMPQDKTIETLEGPIAEIPRASPMFPPEHPEFDPSRVADHNLLLQIRHGQPTSASLNQAPIDADVTGALRTLESQLMSPHPNPYLALSARRQLLAAGYRSILLMPGSMRHPPARFESLIGPMSDGGEDWILFPLTGAVLASEPETGQ